MTQKLSERGAAFIRHHEGFVPNYYLDPVGIPTIGVGFTWRSDSFREWWGRNRPNQAFDKNARMTREEADRALQFMSQMEYGKAVAQFYGRDVSQHVFDASLSAVYNFGVGGLKWKWSQAAKEGKLKVAANLLKTTAVTAKGVPLRGLVIRRQEEAELLEFGDYDIGVNIVYTDPLEDGVLRRGERGAPVTDLQKALASLRLYNGVVDGIYGHGTEAAVLAFQHSKGLNADGVAGPKTLEALKKPVSSLPPDAPIKIEPAEPIRTDPPKRGGVVTWVVIAIFIAVLAVVFGPRLFGG